MKTSTYTRQSITETNCQPGALRLVANHAPDEEAFDATCMTRFDHRTKLFITSDDQ